MSVYTESSTLLNRLARKASGGRGQEQGAILIPSVSDLPYEVYIYVYTIPAISFLILTLHVRNTCITHMSYTYIAPFLSPSTRL